MKFSRSTLMLFLLLTAVAASGLAWKQYQELIQLRAEVNGYDETGYQKRLADAQKRIQSMTDEIAALRSKAWSRKKNEGDPVDDGGAGDPAAGLRPYRGGFMAALNNPQFLQLLSLQQKLALNSKYASLFKSLTDGTGAVALTPDQLNQFQNLLVQKQQAIMDTVQVARDQGINPRTDPAAFSQAVTAAQSAIDQQIQSTLGNAGYSQYQQYEQTLPERNTVNQVQQALSYSQTPLTSDQSNQLMQIIRQDQPNQQPGNGANLRNLLNNNPTSSITDQALTDAQSVLTPSQVQALQQVQQAQQAQAKMQQLLRAGQRPPTSGGGG